MTQLFIPTFRIDECLAEIRECLEKGWTGLGYKTLEIEEAWKKYANLPYAHFLSSNTVGLHLALEVLKREGGWDNDAEVITTPLTFVSTNHAILYANLQPVFADVDEYLCLDPESVLSAIGPKTKALIFVGMGGNTGQLDRIAGICSERGIKLVLDAAHMAGTRVNGVHVGSQADVTVFSFQAVKNLPTADSGMICFKEERHDERARKLSWLGINKDTYARTASQGAYKWMYEVEELGYKYHGNSIMASLALVGLKYLDQDNSYRRQISRWYKEAFEGNDKLRLVPTPEGTESSSHLFQVMVSKREELMLALNEHGIYPGVHYRDNTDYALYAQHSNKCPVAHLASSQLVSLPLHLGLSHDEVLQVAELVNRYA